MSFVPPDNSQTKTPFEDLKSFEEFNQQAGDCHPEFTDSYDKATAKLEDQDQDTRMSEEEFDAQTGKSSPEVCAGFERVHKEVEREKQGINGSGKDFKDIGSPSR